jgi:hypothetical protein
MQTLDVWEMGYLTAFLHVPAISVKKIRATSHTRLGNQLFYMGLCGHGPWLVCEVDVRLCQS